MTKFKILLSGLLSAALLTTGAFAAAPTVEIAVDDETSVITVSGTAEGCGYGDSVSVALLKANQEGDTTDYTQKSLAEIIDADMLASYAGGITDADGSYSVRMSLSGEPSSDFVIVVKASDTDSEAAVRDFFFAALTDKNAFLENIDKSVNGEDASFKNFSELMAIDNAESKTAKLLNISDGSIILKVTRNNLEDIAYSALKKTEDISSLTPAEFVGILEYSAFLAAFGEGLEDPAGYAEEFELDSDFMDTYSKMSDLQKSGYMGLLKGKKLYTKEDVQKAFCDSVCLALIQNPAGWADYNSLIEKHGEYMGIDVEAYKGLTNASQITNYLSSGYTTVEAFKNAVNSAISTLKGGGITNGGSTGVSRPIGGGISGGGNIVSGGSGTVGGKVTGEINTDPAPKTTDGSFSDLESVPWAVESIKGLVEKEIVNGIGGNKFDPDGDVLREQFVKMAVLAAGFVPQDGVSAFADVENGQWYSGYINSAVSNNIVNGIEPDRFGVGENVTRQDAAAVLYRIAKQQGASFAANGAAFADDSDIADYAKEAVYAMRAAGVINGREDNKFCPEEKCSRAEAAKMIYEFIRNFKE